MSEEKTDKVREISEAIAARMNGSNKAVVDAYVDSVVSKEVQNRTELLGKALAKRDQLRADYGKVNRPDNQTFNADGSVKDSSFSKNRLEEIKKAKEAYDKFEATLTKALNDPSKDAWGKLKGACK